MTETKTKKLYRVSLAVLVPQNYEIEIEADSEEEAAKLGVEEFGYKRSAGEFVEVYEEARADFDLEDNFDYSNGIHVEEINESNY